MATSAISAEDEGRLLLWLHALIAARSAISLSRRAADWAKAPQKIEEERAWWDAFQTYARQQPDYQEGVQKSEHLEAFERASPRPFGTVVDCQQTFHCAREQAVTTFCQLFNNGFKQDGVASGNSDFRSRHLHQVLDQAFPSDSDRERFEGLKGQLAGVRDEMLAHADAQAFGIQRTDVGLSASLPYRRLNVLDWDYFTKVVDQLRDVVGAMLSESMVSR